MKSIKKSAVTLFMVLHLCFFFRLDASGGLALDTGYRYDRIDENIALFNPQKIGTNSQQFKNISSYQLGVQGFWDLCHCIFIKGQGHYGWLTHGTYNSLDIVKGELKGFTGDVSAGVGFPLCISAFRFVPLLGYSYDVQKFHLRAHPVTSAVQIGGINGATWRSYFYGPWIGCDWNFEGICPFPLKWNAGYEFHYGWANKRYQQVPTPAILAFPYSSLLKHMRGHVFRLQAFYPFLCRWLVGVKLQYTTWNSATSQRDKIPGSATTGLPVRAFQKTENLRWFSFAATFNLGYIF